MRNYITASLQNKPAVQEENKGERSGAEYH